MILLFDSSNVVNVCEVDRFDTWNLRADGIRKCSKFSEVAVIFS